MNLLHKILLIFLAIFCLTLRSLSDTGSNEVCPTHVIYHDANITDVVQSSDGKNIFTSCMNGTCKRYEKDSEELRPFLCLPKKPVSFITLSPDAQRILVHLGEYGDEMIKLYSMDGQQLGNLMRPDLRIASARFTPDGHKILSTYSKDLLVENYKAVLSDADGNQISEITGDWTDISSLRFSPDSTCIVFTSEYDSVKRSNTAFLWKFEDLAPTEFSHQGKSIIEMFFIPDSTKLILVLGDRTAVSWNYLTGTQNPLEGQGWNYGLSLSPRGTYIGTYSCDNNDIKLLDMQGLQRGSLKRNMARMNYIYFINEGQSIIAPFDDSKFQIWNWQTGEIVKVSAHEKTISDVDISDDDRYLITRSKDGTIKLWNLENRTFRYLKGWDKKIPKVEFSSDSNHVVGYVDNRLFIWDI